MAINREVFVEDLCTPNSLSIAGFSILTTPFTTVVANDGASGLNGARRRRRVTGDPVVSDYLDP